MLKSKKLIETNSVVILATQFKKDKNINFSFFEPEEWITSVVEFIIYLCDENLKLKKEIEELKNGKN